MSDLNKKIDLGHTLLIFSDDIQTIIRKEESFTAEMAKEIVSMRKEVLGDVLVPTLIVTNDNFIEESAQKYVQSKEFAENHGASAVAIVTTSRTKTIILKVITSYMDFEYPIKFFPNEKEGTTWLRSQAS